MKRLFLALGMLLGVAMGAFHAEPASAAVTCQNVNSGTSWPNGPYTQYCTGTTITDADAMFTALNNAPGQTTQTTYAGKTYTLQSWFTAQQKISKYQGVFYLFDTPADFETWAAANLKPAGIAYQTSIPADTYAYSQRQTNGLGPYIYTVIFASNTGLGTNKIVGTTAGHELGHYVDWLFAGTAGKSGDVVSDSADYKAELAVDWQYVNAAKSCYTNNVNGMFTNLADVYGLTPGHSPYYFCTNNGSGPQFYGVYVNDTNQEALQAKTAWQCIYAQYGCQNPQTLLWGELFAETYGAGSNLDGQEDLSNWPMSADYYLGYNGEIAYNGFACTRAFISYLVQHNAVPSKANPPQGWLSVCPLF
ncbi:MAG TPA: hypothetical protein V6C97_08480 [Oculatellaceae cyanobacterium]